MNRSVSINIIIRVVFITFLLEQLLPLNVVRLYESILEVFGVERRQQQVE
jgi:hypothetical protein